MVTALNTLLPRFCADWSLRPTRLEVFVPPSSAALGAKVPAGAVGVVYILDSPDVTGVYGYHDETDKNLAIAKVFTQPVLSHGGKALAGGAMTVAQVFSHEVLELLADAQCNTWWQTAQGDLVAFEVCDPVQLNVVKVRTEPLGDVWCCDWILPAWADAQATGVPLNHLDTLKAPFTCAKGGYLIRMAGGRSTAVFAAGAPQWLQDAKRAHAHRVQTRGAATAPVVRSATTTTAGLLGLAGWPSEPQMYVGTALLERNIAKLRADVAYHERQLKLNKEVMENTEKELQQRKAQLAKLRELQQKELQDVQASTRAAVQPPLCGGDPMCGNPSGEPMSLAQQIRAVSRSISAGEASKALLIKRIRAFEQNTKALKEELDKLQAELQDGQPAAAGIKKQEKLQWLS
jgi:chaperonin cofactor prefoldin